VTKTIVALASIAAVLLEPVNVTAASTSGTTYSTHTFKHGAATLCYRVAGSGPTLVMLAGGPGLSTAYIEPIARHFNNTNTVVLFDQRGTGCSSVSPANAGTLTLAKDRDDIEALRRELGLPSLRLFGHSWGAELAMAYASRYPSGVSLLVLSDSGGADSAFMRAFPKRIEQARTPAEKRALQTLPEGSPEGFRVYFEAYMYDPTKVDLALGNLSAPHYFDPTTNKLMTSDLMTSYHLRSSLGAIRAPTLIVQGAEDPVGADTAADLHRLIPNSTLHTVARAGHFPWAENPSAYYAIIDTFLSENTH
jgi:proline iminopeptidase